MKTKYNKIPVLLPLFLTTGCVTTYDVSSLPPEAALRPNCVANASNRVTVTARDARFGVAPPNLCIRNFGATIIVQVVGAPDDAVTEVHEKSGDPAIWLRGSRTGSGDIRIPVPDDAENERVYSYYVDVSGFGRIDPMISVDR